MSGTASKPVNAWLALAPLLIGTFAATVNNQVVNVPLDAILAGLDVPLSNGVFVVVAFNLSFAVLMPLSGWVGDRLGRRRLFCWAMVGIAIGAVGSALAPTLTVLVTFRILQGVATAAVLPGVMSMIASLFESDRRGHALGLWAAVNGAGQAVGPTMGGLFADWFGWRAIFWPAVPLVFLSVVLTMWLVPRDLPKPSRLEWRGALLLTLSALSFLVAATLIPPLGVASPYVWAIFGCSILVSVAYVLVERGNPLAFLPPGLMLEPRYLRSTLGAFAQMFCLGATLLGVPLALIQIHGLSTSSAGLIILALPLAMTVLAPAAGIATARYSPRITMRSGLIVLVLSEVALALYLGNGREPGVGLIIALAVVGTGVAFVQTPAATGATRSRAGERGVGLGLFNSARFGGSALGASWVATAANAGYGLVFGVCAGVALFGVLVSFTWVDKEWPSPRRQGDANPVTTGA